MRKSSVARPRQPYAGDADAKGIFAEMPGEWRALRWDLAEYAPDCHSFLWSANRKWLKYIFGLRRYAFRAAPVLFSYPVRLLLMPSPWWKVLKQSYAMLQT